MCDITNARLTKCIIHNNNNHNNNNNHSNSSNNNSNGRPRFIENGPVTVIRRHSFEKFEKIKYFCTNRGPSSIRRDPPSKRNSALTSETTLTASGNLEDLPNSIRDPDENTKNSNHYLSTAKVNDDDHDDNNASDASPLAQDTDDSRNEPTASTSCDYLACTIPTLSYINDGKVAENLNENNHNHHQKYQDVSCGTKETVPESASSSSLAKKDANIRDVL